MRSVPSINCMLAWKTGLLLSFLSGPCMLLSQPTAQQLKKFSPVLQTQWKLRSPQENSLFTVAVNDFSLFKNDIEKNSHVRIVFEYKAANIFLVRTNWNELMKSVLSRKEVLFVDEQRRAKEELAVSNLDLSADKVNLVFSKFPNYNGNGIVVSVKENRPDTSDIDFHGRYLSTDISSTDFSTHATGMATIIGGGGNTYYEGKGAAPASTISSSSFAILLPDADDAYQRYNISVQNHSYGTSIENFYGADAAAYDASVFTRPYLVHIFSAGNSGEETSLSGPYASVAGFANITGSFKMAKNIITVGHVDSLGNVLSPSSRGPAYDGRIKPELVAFAEDGSSGAAAIVSGITLVLQQAYKELNNALPPAALVKAILLNSADDVGPKGIDFKSGFGMANAFKALLCLTNAQYFNGSISNGNTGTMDLAVPPNIKQLKITLAWNDPPAAANDAKALVNDLDLELSLPATAEVWQPWVLNHFPNPDSLQLLPARGRDSLNNVEQISIDDPVAGNYKVNVMGFSIPGAAPQAYSIAYQFDTLDRFTWYYPAGIDNIFNERSNILRWGSTYNNMTAQLEYSLDGGNTWRLIDDAVDLTKGYYKWTPPDSFVTAVLRMNAASQHFQSDTFTISRRFDVKVGFNCDDSFMLYWNKIPGVNSYQIYRLGDKYMDPLSIATDTAIVLNTHGSTSLHYAVAPLIGNKTGVKSYAYDYTAQGVGCYIRTFFGEIVNSSSRLDLELGTDYNVKSIIWERLTSNGYVPLQTVNSIQGLNFNYIDVAPKHGLNTYRARIELLNGTVIYSDAITLYFAQEPYFVYPNPVPQYHDVNIISNSPDIAHLQIFNSTGMKVFEQTLNDWSNTISTNKLGKGIYLIRVIQGDELKQTLKLIVY
ncbi:MAG TPA: S8 family peptidase [Chitinophagaceae bacterium]|nr:S8 family peptidase [Chitinophagaceae bacterium]